ncbi:hypothetical protein [Micromonospora coriariae]|uniref:hypothetical protein n=1 Tax=Micromonospora coriariae TaxID=285665 RepID=UPI000B5AF996
MPADIRVLEAEDLTVEEAALTGESEAVVKTVEPVPPDTPLADRRPSRGRGSAADARWDCPRTTRSARRGGCRCPRGGATGRRGDRAHSPRGPVAAAKPPGTGRLTGRTAGPPEMTCGGARRSRTPAYHVRAGLTAGR